MSVRTQPVSPQVKAAVQSLIQRRGVRKTCRELDLAEATVARLAAGIPCSRGTAALVNARLTTLGLLGSEAA